MALPAFALALAGCGLEFPILLESPVGVNNENDSKFEFNSTAANSEAEFRGYEIYYKLFVIAATPTIYYASIDDLIADSYHRLGNPIKDRPGAYYRPLINVDVDDPPTIDVGEAFTVTVDFSNGVSPGDFPEIILTGATLNGEDTTLEVLSARRIVRNFPTNINELKRFTVVSFSESDLSESDSDLTQLVLDEIQASSWAGVSCFAVSWGIDVNQTVVYSIPEWLGFEKIIFPQTEIIF
ncbi:MAG: hypothetical protein A2V99_07760 [Spirochaetes bacterium RBG_16_67_19]|nr:MAG: hypothetical protein A2V99_07760 [Spirochaetes bacterium RBG_16_67_19]